MATKGIATLLMGDSTKTDNGGEASRASQVSLLRKDDRRPLPLINDRNGGISSRHYGGSRHRSVIHDDTPAVDPAESLLRCYYLRGYSGWLSPGNQGYSARWCRRCNYGGRMEWQNGMAGWLWMGLLSIRRLEPTSRLLLHRMMQSEK
jgi:hypothetical protein